jgi:hypothetical protein
LQWITNDLAFNSELSFIHSFIQQQSYKQNSNPKNKTKILATNNELATKPYTLQPKQDFNQSTLQQTTSLRPKSNFHPMPVVQPRTLTANTAWIIRDRL